jgi:protein phosphatase
MNLALKTDVGRRRKVNQDYAGRAYNKNDNLLLVICDGMGGHSSGDFASSSTVNKLTEEFELTSFTSEEEVKEWLYINLLKINDYIYQFSKEEANFYGMGTTLVACVFFNDLIIFANVGDSRLYTIDGNKIKQVSEDQTFVNSLYRAGYINEEEAQNHPRRSVLLFAIGTEKDLQVQIETIENKCDYVLLCSDGLYNMVVDTEILEIVKEPGKDVESKVERLIDTANKNGGIDNIAIILAEVR